MACPWKGMKFESTKEKMFSFRTDEKTLEKLDVIAQNKGISRAEAIRQMIELHFAEIISC